MNETLRAVACFIIEQEYRLPFEGVQKTPVRLCREGTPLAGKILAEPVVAFFRDSRIAHTMSIAEFISAYPSCLEDPRNEGQAAPADATAHSPAPSPDAAPVASLHGIPHEAVG